MVDKTQLPQPVGVTASLPSRYSIAPEKLVRAFPDFVDYHRENERIYKALRQAWIDSTDDIVLAMNKGDVGNAGNIRAMQNDLVAQIRTERQARIDGDTALAIAIDALTAGSGLTSTIFVQSTTPVALATNDLWIDPSNGFRMKYWDGSAWVDMTDQRLFDAIAAITTEQITQATNHSAQATQITALIATTGSHTADIATIFSTYATQTFATAKKTEAIAASATYTDGAVSALSTTITTAYVAADTALSNRIDALVAATGSHVFVQPGTPTALGTNDLWLDSDDGFRKYYWNGSAWVDATDTRLPGVISAVLSETTARTTADTAMASDISILFSSVSSKNSTYRQGTAPSSPTTGDIWIDTANGNALKRWNGTTWVDTTVASGAISASATAITSAYTAADAALNTALSASISSLTATVNLKNTIYRQSTTPSTVIVGDAWIDTANGNALKWWNGTAWVDTTVASAAISAAVASEASARASAVAAEASTRNSADATLTTNLGIVSAAVTAETSARVTADGFLSGKYTLTVAAGDVVTGMNITSSSGSGTNVSVVSFQADKFQINTSSGGNKQIFSATSTAVKLGSVLTVDLANTKMFIGTGSFANSNTSFYVDAAGQFSLKDKLSWDGSTLTIDGNGTFSGALSGATGTFAGSLSAASGTFSGSVDIGSGGSRTLINTSGIVFGDGSNNVTIDASSGRAGIVATASGIGTAELSFTGTSARLYLTTVGGGGSSLEWVDGVLYFGPSSFGSIYRSGAATLTLSQDVVVANNLTATNDIITGGAMQQISTDGWTPRLYTGDPGTVGHFLQFQESGGNFYIRKNGGSAVQIN